VKNGSETSLRLDDGRLVTLVGWVDFDMGIVRIRHGNGASDIVSAKRLTFAPYADYYVLEQETMYGDAAPIIEKLRYLSGEK